MNKHNLDINLTITLERDGKAIKGSPAYLAQKIGSTRHNVLCALYKVRKGRSYRVHGWRIVAEKRKGGNLLQYEYTDPGTIAEAVQQAEWETVDKPVKVEGRYLLRGGKENRQCWMCAMYYRPQLCAKYNDLCADDGIFLDTDARVGETKY